MSDVLIRERIDMNLTRLRLPRMREVLDDTVKTAEKLDNSYLSFLDELIEEEVAQKEQRRIETSLRISGLPFIKTIDDFDFVFQPDIDKQKVMSLFDLTFINRKENVLLLGPPGVGKTHLAVALAVKACHAGMSIYFTSMDDLVTKLQSDADTGVNGKRRSYYKSTLVIVDEVGYSPITRDQCNLFFRFVANRYEKASTIITSNKAFTDWAELFHDTVIVTAILDRLLHHSVIINIKGNSYRLKGKIDMEEENMRENDT